jgi:hypothetical protein
MALARLAGANKATEDGVKMRRLVIASAMVFAATVTASAEITCSLHGGCWETGMKVRLPDSPYRGVTTSVVDRADGKKRIDTRNYKYLDHRNR